MATQTQQPVVVADKTEIEFIPFGSEDKIKLSVNIIQRLIAVPTSDGDIPDQKDCLKFLMLCRSRKLNPFEGDAFLIGYRDRQKNIVNWSLITAHQAFLKRGEAHPEYDGMESGVIIDPAIECRGCEGKGILPGMVCPLCLGKGMVDEIQGDFVPEDSKLIGGWARVYFKNRRHPSYQRLKLATYNKGFGVWNKDAAGMICKCAEAAALRQAFPTSLGGMYLREERAAMEPEVEFQVKAPLFRTAAPKDPESNVTVPQEPETTQPPPEPEAIEAPTTIEPPPERQNAPEAAPGPKSPVKPGSKERLCKQLRVLCSGAKVKEGDVLEHLFQTGQVPAQVGSFEELPIDDLSITFTHWGDIVEVVKEGGK